MHYISVLADGPGGVLYQEHVVHLRPVAYVSTSLNPAERNHPTHKLEFYAFKEGGGRKAKGLPVWSRLCGQS